MSQNKLFRKKKFILLTSFTLLFLSCQKSEKTAAETSDHHQKTSEVKNDMAVLMDEMMDKMQAPKSTGNNDADFSKMMIEHHIGAVKMSELLLNKGKDSELKAFAQKVIAAQNKEIELMKKFQNKSELSPDREQFQTALNQSMGAMMNKEIKVYEDIDRNFAAQMIPHHQSAVDMAKVYLKYGQEKELLQLSEDIVREQSLEITQLKNWLAKK